MKLSHQGNKLAGLALILAGQLALAPQVQAHSEHDKARFVDVKGRDLGLCDNALRPCKTIAYALQHANKGDRVLVAEGEYRITDVEELFLLTSEIVPVLGGYNRYDHYLSQAPQLNPTLLTGVPPEFVEPLTQRGFRVISDGIGRFGTELQARLDEHNSVQQSHGSQACVNGKAGSFSCDKIDLVAHMALGSFSSSPSAANDIWGHVDLNSNTEYAIIGLKNGTAVVSLADPQNPREVGIIRGSSTSWRDIKVYQWFDAGTQRWKAHAYVSSEGSDNIQIIDLSELPNSVSLVATDRAVAAAHNLYISNVDYSTNTALDGLSPALHIVGQSDAGGAFKTYGLTNPGKLSSLYSHAGASRSDYSHDVSTMVIDDARAQGSCQTSLCAVLLDFNEDEIRLWNITNPAQSKQLSQASYTNAAYVHSGWWSEDKRFLFVHDELDEQYHNLNTTLRVFNVDNLDAPSLVKVWSGPTKAIDHNGFVRGNRYYMSNYQRGVTILDISDPASPNHIGYFDTFPASDSNAFNGVWGVYPYLPSGLVLASDINSGLYILKDQSRDTSVGSTRFVTTSSKLNPGDSVSIQVERPQGTGAVSVAYETLGASAIAGTDFYPVNGRLNWDAGDHSVKTIEITTLDSGKKQALLAFVRLFDPQGGLTLVNPGYHSLNIGENQPQPGSAGFDTDSKILSEGSSGLTVQVLRSGGSSGAMRVAYRLESGTAIVGEDVQPLSGELSWADGDATPRELVMVPMEDTLIEGDESFTVQLSSIDSSALSRASLNVTLKDNDRNNTAPTVSAGDNRAVNAGETVTLTAVGADAENDSINYLWQQTGGTAVSLSSANQPQATFVAPNSAATLSFQVTATDVLGASAQANVTIEVKTATVTPVTPDSTSGSGGGSLGWTGLLALLCLTLISGRRQEGTRG